MIKPFEALTSGIVLGVAATALLGLHRRSGQPWLPRPPSRARYFYSYAMVAATLALVRRYRRHRVAPLGPLVTTGLDPAARHVAADLALSANNLRRSCPELARHFVVVAEALANGRELGNCSNASQGGRNDRPARR